MASTLLFFHITLARESRVFIPRHLLRAQHYRQHDYCTQRRQSGAPILAPYAIERSEAKHLAAMPQAGHGRDVSIAMARRAMARMTPLQNARPSISAGLSSTCRRRRRPGFHADVTIISSMRRKVQRCPWDAEYIIFARRRRCYLRSFLKRAYRWRRALTCRALITHF